MTLKSTTTCTTLLSLLSRTSATASASPAVVCLARPPLRTLSLTLLIPQLQSSIAKTNLPLHQTSFGLCTSLFLLGGCAGKFESFIHYVSNFLVLELGFLSSRVLIWVFNLGIWILVGRLGFILCCFCCVYEKLFLYVLWQVLWHFVFLLHLKNANVTGKPGESFCFPLLHKADFFITPFWIGSQVVYPVMFWLEICISFYYDFAIWQVIACNILKIRYQSDYFPVTDNSWISVDSEEKQTWYLIWSVILLWL